MDLDEALAWLRGERSTRNVMFDFEINDDRQLTFVREAETDAAMTQQAYWIIRAHREELAGVSVLCQECESSKLSWFPSGLTAVLGCDECSATVRVEDLDAILRTVPAGVQI